MSIWGSLIGGFVGFSFAGPIGALIGSMIGGRISSARRSGFKQSFAQSQQVFAIALVILAAKLSKADDHVSKEELVAVKQKLKIPNHEIEQVGKIFNKAKEGANTFFILIKLTSQTIKSIFSGTIFLLRYRALVFSMLIIFFSFFNFSCN